MASDLPARLQEILDNRPPCVGGATDEQRAEIAAIEAELFALKLHYFGVASLLNEAAPQTRRRGPKGGPRDHVSDDELLGFYLEAVAAENLEFGKVPEKFCERVSDRLRLKLSPDSVRIKLRRLIKRHACFRSGSAGAWLRRPRLTDVENLARKLVYLQGVAARKFDPNTI